MTETRKRLTLTTTKETMSGHFGDRKLSVILDRGEDYAGGTPAMVRLYKNLKEIDCATWDCLRGEGSFENYPITDQESAWLDKQAKRVESFLETLENA